MGRPSYCTRMWQKRTCATNMVTKCSTGYRIMVSRFSWIHSSSWMFVEIILLLSMRSLPTDGQRSDQFVGEHTSHYHSTLYQLAGLRSLYGPGLGRKLDIIFSNECNAILKLILIPLKSSDFFGCRGTALRLILEKFPSASIGYRCYYIADTEPKRDWNVRLVGFWRNPGRLV